uniref:Uncharacterized protein n=1 Tax=Anguilla anguilla TaxID=7936 RepID=A0A0E9XH60_ANGAN
MGKQVCQTVAKCRWCSWYVY